MSKIFVNSLHSRIEKGLTSSNEKQMLEAIVKVIDKNTATLREIGPMHMIYFTSEDASPIFKFTGIKEEEVNKTIKEVKATGLKCQWSNVGKPFLILLTLIIRHYKLKKQTDKVKILLLYYGISLYPSLFFKYFKYEPSPAVMEYTINNLSNKYSIKKLGTMYAVIDYSMGKADETSTNSLIKGEDRDICNYIQDKKARLNDIFKNISIEYYKNHNEQKFMNVDYDNFDEEGFHESKSSMQEVEKLSDKITMKLIVNGPDMKIINASAKLNQVSVNELRNYVSILISSNNKEDIRTVIQCILSLYLFDGGNSTSSIKSDKFVTYCFDVYKRANTSDRNVIAIKKILDKWLDDVGLLAKTSNGGTINNFRRALFTFFVFTIEKLS